MPVFPALALWLLLASLPVTAGTIVLRIMATNPIEKSQTVQIKSNLPPRIGTNDVVSSDGLAIGYDVKSDIYYVHREVELGPHETKQFDIEINDVWLIPAGEIDALSRQARALAAKLEGNKDYRQTAAGLKKQVDGEIEGIVDTQEAGKVRPGVKPIDHIRAYETNLERLKRVKKDVGRLENLVLAVGLDAGSLVGDSKAEEMRRRPVPAPSGGYGSAVIRITVRNTSPTEKRGIDVSRDLPPELKIDDVLDADGLEVARDPNRDICMVRIRDLELEPGEIRPFNIRVRDKWNVNQPRIGTLRVVGDGLLEKIRAKDRYESLEETVVSVLADLDRIAAETGPEELSDEYVAFYRSQANRLDVIERRINRIEDALKPITATKKWGFNVKPPSPKTTWLIIYIILGFLAVVSLLFFFRWYGRTQSERMGASSRPSDEG